MEKIFNFFKKYGKKIFNFFKKYGKKIFNFFKKYGKKIAKYTLNTINFINAILLVLDPIWNIPMGDKISATLVGIAGVISVYLLGDKGVQKLKKDGE